MTGAQDERNPFDVLQAPPPGYVVTVQDRERWTLAGRIAEVMWETFEPGTRIDNSWLWMMQRSIYFSDLPTGAAEDQL